MMRQLVTILSAHWKRQRHQIALKAPIPKLPPCGSDSVDVGWDQVSVSLKCLQVSLVSSQVSLDEANGHPVCQVPAGISDILTSTSP